MLLSVGENSPLTLLRGVAWGIGWSAVLCGGVAGCAWGARVWLENRWGDVGQGEGPALAGSCWAAMSDMWDADMWAVDGVAGCATGVSGSLTLLVFTN